MGSPERDEGPEGLLLVDKSAGPTSADVVRRVRRCLGVRRVGHAGTLDPFATGLLLLCVGRVTRLVRYLHLLPKTYRARVRLGEETDTLDPEGKVVTRSEGWRELGRERIEAATAGLTGTIDQVPPLYSAVKVDGRRAYDAARAGERVALEARPVHVASFRVLALDLPDLEVEVVVATGTYVRALARDLGRALGCGAHLRALRRTSIGPFLVDEALGDGELGAAGPADLAGSAAWRTPAATVAWLPRRDLDAEEVERVRHGGRVSRGTVRPGPGPEDHGGSWAPAAPDRERLPVALVREGALLAVADADGPYLQPRVVLDAA